MSQGEIPAAKPRRTAAAIALIVIGLLFLVPSGLCTGFFGAMAVLGVIYEPQNSGMSEILPVLMVGGPFILIGALLLRLGLRARKRS